MPTINGYEYGYIDVQVVIEGSAVPVRGITDFEYGSSREHVNIKGRGAQNVAKGRGGKDYAGRITLLQSEVEALQAALPAGYDLTDKDVNITVGYAPIGGTLVVDQLVGCRIPNFRKGMNTESTHMTVALELVIFNINYNI